MPHVFAFGYAQCPKYTHISKLTFQPGSHTLRGIGVCLAHSLTDPSLPLETHRVAALRIIKRHQGKWKSEARQRATIPLAILRPNPKGCADVREGDVSLPTEAPLLPLTPPGPLQKWQHAAHHHFSLTFIHVELTSPVRGGDSKVTSVRNVTPWALRAGPRDW